MDRIRNKKSYTIFTVKFGLPKGIKKLSKAWDPDAAKTSHVLVPTLLVNTIMAGTIKFLFLMPIHSSLRGASVLFHQVTFLCHVKHHALRAYEEVKV
jgi:hypothetical protein